MAGAEIRRKAAFVISVLVLTAWAGVLGLDASGGGHPKDAGENPAQRAPRPGGSRAGVPDDQARSAVARAAMEFTDAYLGYEVGAFSRSDRRALMRLSTRQLGAQLLGDRPTIPSTVAPAREWASRVEAVHVGIFDGAPALLVGVLVVGVNGGHVLTPTFVRRDSRWLVAGIGA